MNTHLADADRLAIRTELAKAMGWRITTLPGWQMAWLSPDEATQDEPPNPFTDAADNRALIGFIAKQDGRANADFLRTLIRSVGGLPMWMEIVSTNPNPKMATFMALLTAPLETIALAAAAALGITAPPPEAAPPPAPPEAPRRE